MRILHVISSADPKYGGPIEGILQAASVQIARGHSVEVASADDPSDPALVAFPLKLHALGPGRTPYRHAPNLLAWLLKRLREYDAAVVNGLWQYSGYAVRYAAMRTNTPYFVFTHGMLDPWFKKRYPLKHLKKWLVWPWADYRVLRDASGVLFTCEEERLRARESFWLYRGNEIVVGYGTRGSDGDPEVERAAFLNRFPHLRDKRILLFMGRLHEKKGCDLLVHAFSRVCIRDPRLCLVMAGPDQNGLKSELVAQARQFGIEDRITWTGMLAGEIKWGAIRSAAVFVLPSHQENFGIVVAEALACGVPVLISDKVNIWREIESDRAGFVAEDNLQGTAAMLEKWLALDPDQEAALRLSARRCYESRFDVRISADKLYVEIYARIFGRRNAVERME